MDELLNRLAADSHSPAVAVLAGGVLAAVVEVLHPDPVRAVGITRPIPIVLVVLVLRDRIEQGGLRAIGHVEILVAVRLDFSGRRERGLVVANREFLRMLKDQTVRLAALPRFDSPEDPALTWPVGIERTERDGDGQR